MLTLKTLRDNPEMVVAKLAKKNFDAKAIVAEIWTWIHSAGPSRQKATPSSLPRTRWHPALECL